MSRRASIAVFWGLLIGGLTFAAGPLTSLSDHAAIAAIQIILTCLMTPGLIVAARNLLKFLAAQRICRGFSFLPS